MVKQSKMQGFVQLVLAACLLATGHSKTLQDITWSIDTSGISTSGLSAGGAMAIQLHVAYSDTFMGVASYAGIVYRCAEGSLLTALNTCMYFPNGVNVDKLIADADEYEAEGTVDALSGLQGDRVYVFHGTKDYTVGEKQTDLICEFYEHYGSECAIDNNLAAGHGMPTVDYGVNCDATRKPYINECNYDGAYIGLNYIYHDQLTEPDSNTPIMGEFMEFEQEDFNGGDHMHNYGYIYFPTGCMNGESCRLHVALHGCDQGRAEVDDEYARYGGYLQTAEVNNIITVFPQVKDSLIANPNACWDWWGYDGQDYATKTGIQMQAIKAMVDYLVDNGVPSDPVDPPEPTDDPSDPSDPCEPEWCPCMCPCPGNL